MTLQHIDLIRINIDRLIQNAAAIKSSPEMTLAWRSLQMAKSWMGKIKGELGSTTPYVVVDKAENIPTTAEVYDGPLEETSDKLLAINSLRAGIEGATNDVKSRNQYDFMGVPAEGYRTHVIQHLSEARFWYGFELANMREEALKQ